MFEERISTMSPIKKLLMVGIFLIAIGFILDVFTTNNKNIDDSFMKNAVEIEVKCTKVESYVKSLDGDLGYKVYVEYEYTDSRKVTHKCSDVIVKNYDEKIAVGTVFKAYIDSNNPTYCRIPNSEKYYNSVNVLWKCCRIIGFLIVLACAAIPIVSKVRK